MPQPPDKLTPHLELNPNLNQGARRVGPPRPLHEMPADEAQKRIGPPPGGYNHEKEAETDWDDSIYDWKFKDRQGMHGSFGITHEEANRPFDMPEHPPADDDITIAPGITSPIDFNEAPLGVTNDEWESFIGSPDGERYGLR